VRCLFPDLGVMVGFAVTARFSAELPAARPASRSDLWKRLAELPEPRVMVMQDLDQPAGVGAYFGEVQSTIHKRLGCVGVVTNGHVRDLDEVHPMGFHYFAGGVCVSHAYVHLVDFGTPVKVGGTVVKTGDLIHADKHGVLVVPVEIAREVPQAAAKVAEREQKIISHCHSAQFSIDDLKRLYEA
jgi:4-hydroxy-4-methyl-2-oxoglutarate aldolase